jgi:hypothetical protein
MNESYEPSPIEIWRQCVDIQALWTRDEERRRRDAGEEQWRLLNRGSAASILGTRANRLDTGFRLQSGRRLSEFES